MGCEVLPEVSVEGGGSMGDFWVVRSGRLGSEVVENYGELVIHEVHLHGVRRRESGIGCPFGQSVRFGITNGLFAPCARMGADET